MEEKRCVTMEKLVNLCKSRGIIFPGSEIYGGMGNTWDYGPVGVEIKNNVIIFNVKNSGEYVLVISGNKAISGNNDVSEKTIEVFGNVLKQSTFFAIVGSIAAVTILVVGALVFLLIRKNR